MPKKTKNAIRILDRMVRNDIALREMIEEERLHAAIARMIFDARTKAGLTQAELARKVGTRQPAIARIEDADYRGHSLGLLSRIASALDLALSVRLQPATAWGRTGKKHRAAR